MGEPRRIVIVGTGLAGAMAAGGLRDKGYTGELLMLGQEAHRPYELPALSKGILLGETNDPAWVYDEAAYAERDIELRLSTVVASIKPDSHEVVEEDGTHAPVRPAAARDRLAAAPPADDRRAPGRPAPAALARRRAPAARGAAPRAAAWWSSAPGGSAARSRRPRAAAAAR